MLRHKYSHSLPRWEFSAGLPNLMVQASVDQTVCHVLMLTARML